jgi:hypothetical protein
MSIRTQLIAAGVCVAVGFGTAWTAQGWRYGEQIAGIERDQAQAVADAQSLARATEHRRQAAIEGVQNAANEKIAAASADAAASAAVAVRLRAQVERLRGAASDPAATIRGPAADDPVGVLAVVLGELDDRAGVLAEYANRARIAGLACEAAYDGVRAVR